MKYAVVLNIIWIAVSLSAQSQGCSIENFNNKEAGLRPLCTESTNHNRWITVSYRDLESSPGSRTSGQYVEPMEPVSCLQIGESNALTGVSIIKAEVYAAFETTMNLEIKNIETGDRRGVIWNIPSGWNTVEYKYLGAEMNARIQISNSDTTEVAIGSVTVFSEGTDPDSCLENEDNETNRDNTFGENLKIDEPPTIYELPRNSVEFNITFIIAIVAVSLAGICFIAIIALIAYLCGAFSNSEKNDDKPVEYDSSPNFNPTSIPRVPSRSPNPTVSNFNERANGNSQFPIDNYTRSNNANSNAQYNRPAFPNVNSNFVSDYSDNRRR